ncbi:winged helix-turn-helix transcriptional regulator [Actinoplanes friuliensis]|uniref:Cinnamoyl ester hydrolase n=1 Tax=Actinoplanes friuliensis DSM 7358 TaxID=1246995 RepID=U5W4H0_9ACTN|nr:helix-turn-helix domain-containing protein [Actinoplanes friuliensis]AGZ44088.1 cinnamoyl ester hydrolase [Actinoplanes friuliensis DSM 7358]
MATLAQPKSGITVFDVYAATCPSRALLDLVTSRWAVLVIGALEEHPQRFGALRRRLEGVSQKVLTEKLRDLEAEGLISRTVVDRPLAVYYELTPIGRTLVQPLAALRDWAQTHCDGHQAD